MSTPNVLIWHIHGSYLSYIARARANFFLPVKPGRPEGYGGKGRTFQWPETVQEVPAEQVRDLSLDLVVHQSPKNYFQDQIEILSEQQRRLPRIYLEHNTPKEHPTDSKHPVDDPDTLLVHVTHYNRMMWDSGRCPTIVIEHGVAVADDLQFAGELDRGIVVVNELKRRNRVAGYDVFSQMRGRVPLDLVGMASEQLGGMGDIPHGELHRLEARYRFFFNPIRYTSLPLALVEAMALGMPIVALATTEIPTVIQDGVSGFVSNNVDYLEQGMQRLLADRGEAERMGREARRVARERFSIQRFARDWEAAFEMAMGERGTAASGNGGKADG